MGRRIPRPGVNIRRNRSPRGGENHFLDPVNPGQFQKMDQPQDVDPGIVQRIRDAVPNVDLCGVVVDHIEAPPPEHVPQRRRSDVGPHEAGAGIDVPPFSRGEVVHHRHGVPRGDVGVHHVGTDEAGPPGDEDSHAGPPGAPLTRACRAGAYSGIQR